VSAADQQVIRWGNQRARTGPWRGDSRVAYLAPAGDPRPLRADFVRHCADELHRRGYTEVVTAALAPPEQTGFLDAGFTVAQRLVLLAHDMGNIPPSPRPNGVRLRRARPDDRPGVIRLDSQVFDEFWSLDDSGLDEAITATPRSRFRVAVPDEGDGALGYAVTGRARHRGYLQRLAVDAKAQHRGVGRALVIDALRWLHRWRAERTLVNTQVGNDRAMALYESLGFLREPVGLAVLSRDLTR
jgi:GNAT superfamily N-acetyltransferase